MHPHPKPARYHGHRYHLEQDDLLSGREPETPAQAAIRRLDARLKAITAAENALATDLTPHFARAFHTRTLGGRTPEQARVAAHRHFALAYSDAVAAEKAAA